MAKVVFCDYYMVDEERMKDYTVANVSFGINAADSGMQLSWSGKLTTWFWALIFFMTPTMRNWKSRARFRRSM